MYFQLNQCSFEASTCKPVKRQAFHVPNHSNFTATATAPTSYLDLWLFSWHIPTNIQAALLTHSTGLVTEMLI